MDSTGKKNEHTKTLVIETAGHTHLNREADTFLFEADELNLVQYPHGYTPNMIDDPLYTVSLGRRGDYVKVNSPLIHINSSTGVVRLMTTSTAYALLHSGSIRIVKGTNLLSVSPLVYMNMNNRIGTIDKMLDLLHSTGFQLNISDFLTIHAIVDMVRSMASAEDEMRKKHERLQLLHEGKRGGDR